MVTKQQNKGEVKGAFVVRNDRGLHTRPCTEIVKCAAGYKAEIWLAHGKMVVNAKSLLGILTLAATRGTKIKIEAIGKDAEEAVSSLLDLANRNFNMQY